MHYMLAIRDRWFRFIKKYILAILFFVAALVVLIMIMALSKGNEVSIKQEVFKHEVNTELDKTASNYLEHVKDDEAEIDFSKVNVQELGQYQGLITYKDEIYPIKFLIQDTIPPVLESGETAYVYSFDDSLELINDEVNRNLRITDNYDTEFAPLEIVTEIPKEEKEITIALSVMDTSDNISNVVVLTIQFTHTGERAAELPQEMITKNIKLAQSTELDEEVSSVEHEENDDTASSVVTGSSQQRVPSESVIDQSTQSNNSDSTNNEPSNNSSHQGNQNSPVEDQPDNSIPVPAPEPEPEPQPTQKPNYTVPEGALDGGLFDSEEAAIEWALNIINDPNSAWFHCQVHGDQLDNGQYRVYILPY